MPLFNKLLKTPSRDLVLGWDTEAMVPTPRAHGLGVGNSHGQEEDWHQGQLSGLGRWVPGMESQTLLGKTS